MKPPIIPLTNFLVAMIWLIVYYIENNKKKMEIEPSNFIEI